MAKKEKKWIGTNLNGKEEGSTPQEDIFRLWLLQSGGTSLDRIFVEGRKRRYSTSFSLR